MIRRRLFVLAMTLVALASSRAEAVPLLPGGFIGPGIPSTLDGTDPGALLALLSSPFDTNPAGAGTTGTFLSAVYRLPDLTLSFYYQVFVDVVEPLSDGINRVTMRNFTGWTTDVSQRLDDPDDYDFAPPGDAGWVGPPPISDAGVAPLNAFRNAAGSQIDFDFFVSPSSGFRINAGQHSNVLVIDTDALYFAELVDGGSVINGGTDNINALAPTAVPEPGSMILLGSGLFGIAAAIRRRGKKTGQPSAS